MRSFACCLQRKASYRPSWVGTLCLPGPGKLLVECQVEQKNVDPGFAEKAEAAALCETVDEPLDLRGIDATSLCDSIKLSRRISGADVWIQAASACRQSIRRNRTIEIRILLPELFCSALDSIDE